MKEENWKILLSKYLSKIFMCQTYHKKKFKGKWQIGEIFAKYMLKSECL